MVADPSIGKSPAMSWAFRPLTDLDEEYYAQYKREFSEWMEECKTIKKKADYPPPPTEKHLVIGNATIEALIAALGENPRGIVFKVDELQNFLVGLTNYNANSGSAYLSLWSGEGGKTIRKGSETVQVTNPSLNIFGGIQPEILDVMVSDTKKSDGFIWRFLFCFAAPKPFRDWETIKNAQDITPLKHTYSKMLKQILSLEGNNLIGLDNEADQVWGKFFNNLKREILKTDDSDRKDYLGKFSIMCTRIALILQVMEWIAGASQLNFVSGKTMQNAIVLTRFLVRQTEKALKKIETKIEEKKEENIKIGSSFIDWVRIFNGSATLTTKEIIDRVFQQPGKAKSERTIERYIKAELTKVSRGEYAIRTS